ncbi:aminoglycoside adenylyltransferase domain-containing protein [Methylobacterium sp. JK268]
MTRPAKRCLKGIPLLRSSWAASTPVDTAAAETARAYLAVVDAALPGLVRSLHLVGSAVSGDFRPGASDVNFVAATQGPGHTHAVEAVHRGIGPGHPLSCLDGIYVTEEELRLGTWEASGPHVRRGRFLPTGSHGRRAPDRYAFATGAVAARGATPPGLEHRVPIRDINRDLLLLAAEAVAAARGEALPAWEASSLVLGTARLHYTLLTGRLTTKTDAGLYGLMTFPQCWAPVLDQALAVRRDGPNSRADLRSGEVAAFAAMVAADMQELALEARG